MVFESRAGVWTFSKGMEKILIIHSGGIGDLLLALPAMRSFRRYYSRARLELLGRSERLPLVAFDLAAQTILSIDRAAWAYLYLEEGPLPESLSSFFGAFQAILLFGRSNLSRLSEKLQLAGAQRIVAIPSFPSQGSRLHVRDFLHEAMEAQGFGVKDLTFPLTLPPEILEWGRHFLEEKGMERLSKVLAIHPGSGSSEKNWPLDRFWQLGEWAKERCRVLWILGPAEIENSEVSTRFKKPNVWVADQVPLLNLAGILKGCSAYLGNDSGITHLASSLGIPTVALFGPTDPSVWGPKGSAVKIVYNKGGMEEIHPVEAMEAIASFLS
jgi:ADP-heptose:LPS heptosyltransferase